MSEVGQDTLTLTKLVEQSYAYAARQGFWDHREGNPSIVAEKLALVHSEVSEALEEHRAGKPLLYAETFELGVIVEAETLSVLKLKPEGLAAELADAVIRIADLCGALGIDLEQAVRLKHAYNLTRPYKHSKAF